MLSAVGQICGRTHLRYRDDLGLKKMGKNDKEVCGDAAGVTQRRSEALRLRAAAIQAHLDEIKPVAKAPVSAAALAADRAALKKMDGAAAKLAVKTAGKVATDERTFVLRPVRRGAGAVA